MLSDNVLMSVSIAKSINNKNNNINKINLK